ncbi:hypothetical protein [Vibrio sp. ER1A]|uniref:hypothetical protein n=1 Tax=Vibrio sp. ER1A TaxID=1517681 RepID=UPI0004DCE9F8|nr:hypothetical protein [Vibrio sp. ER1A]KFA98783.1 hypothetical protein HW45_07110 [Vibrio sp. ER1A]
MREFSIEVDSALDEAFRDAMSEMTSCLKAGVSTAGSLVSREAREEAPKAESALTNSIKSRVVSQLERLITSKLNYNEHVVNGTAKQGLPPVRSIEDWIKVKRITPHNPKHSTRDLAFMMARHIAANGTQPNDFYDRAADRVEDKVADILHKSAQMAMQRAGLRMN